MKSICVILASVLLYSCSPKQKVYKHLQGQWLIEAIYYDNQNVITEYLTNGIGFKGEFGDIPAKLQKVNGETDWDLTQKERGKIIAWDLIQKDTLFFIKYHTKDEVFKDTLQIKFYKEEGFNKMDLTNERTYIKLNKWAFLKPE